MDLDRFSGDASRLSMADWHEAAERRRISRRGFIQAALVGAGGLVAGPVLWRRPGYAAETPGGLHLAFGADPRKQVTVSWLTTGAVEHPVLDVGPTAAYGRTVAAETRVAPGSGTRYHHAVVEGLAPGTTYHYRVRHDGGTSDDVTFRTAPGRPEPFVFTAFGDQGVNAAAAATTRQVAGANPAFHLHAGDICYANSTGMGGDNQTYDAGIWDRWFNQVAPVAQSRPWMTAVGNHEMEPGSGPQGYDGYFARFTMPGGGPARSVHLFRYGNVAFLSLDANDVSAEITHNTGYTGGAQDRWLNDTLAGLRADPQTDFIVAQFHHCVYCSNLVHSSDGGVREHWAGLFDQYGVDLVLNGHNHCYERAHPIKQGKVTSQVPSGGTIKPVEQGTTYLTVGGGGQTSYPTFLPVAYVNQDGGARVPEPALYSAVKDPANSLITVLVAPAPGGVTRMKVQALKSDGSPLDSFTIERPAKPPVAAEQAQTPTAVSGAGRARPAPAGAAAGAGTGSRGQLPATGGREMLTAGVALAGAGAGLARVVRRSQTSEGTEQ